MFATAIPCTCGADFSSVEAKIAPKTAQINANLENEGIMFMNELRNSDNSNCRSTPEVDNTAPCR